MGDKALNPSRRHRVVIVGGGFGGVRAAKALKRLPVDVTLIDRNNHHLFQPLLYQVATGVLSPGQIAPALRTLFRGQDNVRVLMGEVERFDLERRVVHAVAQHEMEIEYDTLIVAAGATHSYFGNDDWAPDAPGMKTLDDANRVRSRILWAFELAEQAQTQEERDALLTFVVVGAGPTGVELAGQIAILARRVLKKEHRAIDTRAARVVLLDAAPSVLPPFPEKLRDHAEHDLRKLGVDVELGAMAVDIDEDGIDVRPTEGGETRRIPARTVLWAAGVQASPLATMLAEESGTTTDRAGRLLVRHDLTLPVHPEVFAIGDMVSRPGVPGVAQAAIQEGKYVAKVISARINQYPEPPTFAYKDKGTMATIGRTRAVAKVRGVKLTGQLAYYIWAFVHVAYLVGWGNRFEAVARWMWTIVARNRRERLISPTSLLTEQQVAEEIEASRERSRVTV
ncbi:NAD(P)/FAD-dependent oxidoreductase [Conexibacter stalactiti]|uniref:NADH:ubiquinone reductase (non-electrogenic) n=1 Tax=Conexibacter stalactiti TaxID=1940611 RepID=A0ABU4HN32_9ACTN|nr:NAD(P)/FAD-dependent oxidoreductase [Conexibacter stalactiti]MDW5594728.1 NAD(P)/FAD-dependent oxidoreductase [Conexibacter stalactiti]MEC5035370.1 NAD(P)/FAD-dependent oxidoreductase [Conexibacter stalactiti]